MFTLGQIENGVYLGTISSSYKIQVAEASYMIAELISGWEQTGGITLMR